MATLRITFEPEDSAAQSFLVECAHGIPAQVLRPLNAEGLEDTLDFIRTQVRAGNFKREKSGRPVDQSKKR